MYSFLKGELYSSRGNTLVIDVNGIGFSIQVPTSAISKLPPQGEKITLHTSFVIRENSQALYGFFEEQERDVFEQLLTVSGIGPKSALSLISHLNIRMLHEAIATANSKKLSETPGIGKKMAERLILELKGKLHVTSALLENTASLREQEALSALLNLGYNQKNASLAVSLASKEVKEGDDVATLVRVALKHAFTKKN